MTCGFGWIGMPIGMPQIDCYLVTDVCWSRYMVLGPSEDGEEQHSPGSRMSTHQIGDEDPRDFAVKARDSMVCEWFRSTAIDNIYIYICMYIWYICIYICIIYIYVYHISYIHHIGEAPCMNHLSFQNGLADEGNLYRKPSQLGAWAGDQRVLAARLWGWHGGHGACGGDFEDGEREPGAGPPVAAWTRMVGEWLEDF